MKSKLKFLYLLLFFVFISVTCKKAELGNTSPCTITPTAFHPKGTAYQNLIETYIAQGLPGMSLLIGDSAGVWYGSGGKSDLENNIAYSPCTVQKLGSITKMIIGTLIMKLVEEGKVNIDDKVSKWLSASLIKDIKNADKVTLRNCLQHTTGIYDIIGSSDFYLAALHDPNKHWKGEELLSFVRNQPAAFEANTKSGYSNTNFLLLTLCLEKITGKDHSELLHEKIFGPLGMHDTYYHTHDALPSITAQGYYDLYNNKTIVNVSNIVTGNGWGFTGVYSNLFDLQKFVLGVFINKTVLKQATLDQMMQWIPDADNSDFGLGLFRKDNNLGINFRVGHTGGDLGYASEVYYFPATNRYFIMNVNYGTNGESFLKPTYKKLVNDLVELVKK